MIFNRNPNIFVLILKNMCQLLHCICAGIFVFDYLHMCLYCIVAGFIYINKFAFISGRVRKNWDWEFVITPLLELVILKKYSQINIVLYQTY